MDGLIEGRVVHFVLADGPRAGEHRAADVVRVEDAVEGRVNLHVKLDGILDSDSGVAPVIRHVRNVPYDAQMRPGTWHWIERA